MNWNPFKYKKPEAVAYLHAAHQVMDLRLKGSSPQKDRLVAHLRWCAAMAEFLETDYDCGAASEIGCTHSGRSKHPCRVHCGDERWKNVGAL